MGYQLTTNKTEPTVETLLDAGERHVRDMLLVQREKSLVPFYHLVGPDTHAILMCRFGSEIEKQLQILAAKKAARQMGAKLAMFVAESWMVKMSVGEWERRGDTMDPPSQDPRRIEVVSIAATDGKSSRGRLLQMERNRWNGRITGLVALPEPETAEFGGRMLDGLLDP